MSIGKVLRDQRVALGWEIHDIAASLRIQPSYLEAIEAEDFRTLPGGAYTIGFVKAYARALGENEESIAAAFRREQADVLRTAPLRIRSPIVESRVPTVSLVVLAALIGIAAWIAWAYFGDRQPVIGDAVPAVPERLTQSVEANSRPAEGAGTPAVVASGMTQPATATSQPLAASPMPATIPAGPPGGGESEEAQNDTDQPGEIAGVRTANPDMGLGAIMGSSTYPSRVEIHTSDDSWIQIRDASHNAIFTGVMHAGDVYKLPNAPGYSFTAGNAGAVTLVVDGVAGAALGTAGQVLRNVAVPSVSPAGKP
jgi:cytoskeleton protein RodZ